MGNKNNGQICLIIISISRQFNIWVCWEIVKHWPCWVVLYKIILYAAENRDKKVIVNNIILDILEMPTIKIISPKRFNENGPPKLQTSNKNHITE